MRALIPRGFVSNSYRIRINLKIILTAVSFETCCTSALTGEVSKMDFAKLKLYAVCMLHACDKYYTLFSS